MTEGENSLQPPQKSEPTDNLLLKIFGGDPPSDLVKKMAQQHRDVMKQRSRLGIKEGDTLADMLKKTQKLPQSSE